MILQDYRDPVPEYVPTNVKKLIEDMWSPNYNKRPTSKQVIERIKELVEELKTAELVSTVNESTKVVVKENPKYSYEQQLKIYFLLEKFPNQSESQITS